MNKAIIETRPAKFSDARDLFDWRNDFETRAMSVNQSPLSWDSHVKWLENTIADKDRWLLVSEIGDLGKIGSCRFDNVASEHLAYVSLMINPKFRGSGFGLKVLESSLDFYFESCEFDVIAKIREGNLRSVSTFTRAGFELIGPTNDGLTIFRLNGTEKERK